jgi:hypothetical protein
LQHGEHTGAYIEDRAGQIQATLLTRRFTGPNTGWWANDLSRAPVTISYNRIVVCREKKCTQNFDEAITCRARRRTP